MIISPLRVSVSKKKMFTLNTNNYRNSHHMVLNKSKQEYKREMSSQIAVLGYFKKIHIHYELFTSTHRRCDLDNVISIHKKYFQDALVELKHIADDDITHIVSNSESYGGYKKNAGYVEITITEVE